MTEKKRKQQAQEYTAEQEAQERTAEAEIWKPGQPLTYPLWPLFFRLFSVLFALAVKEMKKDPAFADKDKISVKDIMKWSTDAEGNPTGQFKKILDRLAAVKADEEIKQLIAEAAAAAPLMTDAEIAAAAAAAELPRIMLKQVNQVQYPLDKPNSEIWGILEAADPNGQLSLAFNTSKKGRGQDAIIYYGISFDEQETGLKITKTLTPFDKRVYIAAAALFNGGNNVISATQIYKMMGNSGQPKAKQVQKINDSLTKMEAAHVFLDNTYEAQVYKNYPRFKYDASLLPFERTSAYINNTLTEAAIHLFREPPLITFARERGQITSLSQRLLESPISKTDANLQIEDYLLERIGHMKSPKSHTPRKMLFTTIYDKCGIKTWKQRSRALKKITRYLDHYKKCGWIAGYTIEQDGITIQL